MHRKSYWRNSEKWVCPKHLPSVVLPSNIPTCWFSGCSSVRPPLPTTTERKATVAVADLSVPFCAWKNCNRDNGKKAKRTKTSKYCSTACKNCQARYNYRQRKKNNA